MENNTREYVHLTESVKLCVATKLCVPGEWGAPGMLHAGVVRSQYGKLDRKS